jgi:tetrahedral aminopeptidase
MLLEKLSRAPGVSGCEGEVRQILKEELAPYVDRLETDVMGNLLAFKEGPAKEGPVKGEPVPVPRVMLAAHMDEVGLVVTEIDGSGLLKFKTVGGIDDRVLLSKAVLVGPDRVSGVIGAKAIHLQKEEERGRTLTVDQLYIDIGAGSEEEAKKKVKTGDYIAFATVPRPFGDGCFLGKALDDRVGCCIVAELLKEELPLAVHAAFTVQEEVGLRGAAVAAYRIKPDLALVVETTAAADVAHVPEQHQSTELGKGPALTLMDGTFISHKPLLDFIIGVAEEAGLPYQFRRFTAAGTDAGRISISGDGVPTAVISTPCRYLHGPRSLVNLQDVEGVKALLRAVLKSLAKGGHNLWKSS